MLYEQLLKDGAAAKMGYSGLRSFFSYTKTWSIHEYYVALNRFKSIDKVVETSIVANSARTVINNTAADQLLERSQALAKHYKCEQVFNTLIELQRTWQN